MKQRHVGNVVQFQGRAEPSLLSWSVPHGHQHLGPQPKSTRDQSSEPSVCWLILLRLCIRMMLHLKLCPLRPLNPTSFTTVPKIRGSDFSAGKKVPAESPLKPRRSFLRLVFRLLLLLLLGLAGVAAVCHLTDMQKEAMCAPVNVAVDNGLLWAREQEDALRRLVRSLSAALKDFLESSQASKT